MTIPTHPFAHKLITTIELREISKADYDLLVPIGQVYWQSGRDEAFNDKQRELIQTIWEKYFD